MSKQKRKNAPASVFGLPVSWKTIGVTAAVVFLVSFIARKKSGSSSPDVSGRLGDFEVFRQGDSRWSAIKLGISNISIGRAGCLLTALSMASNYLRGTKIRPDDANEMGKRVPGSFVGANTSVPVLADALGLAAPENLRIRATLDSEALKRRAQSALASSGIAIFHVDHDGSLATGDHFILCLGLNQGQYVCADPATGKYAAIDPSTLKGLGFSGKTYTVLGVIPVFRKNEAPATLS